MNALLSRLLYHRYPYAFEPEQLAFLVECLNETRDVPGDIVEAGCFRGHTTCFLNRHLAAAGIKKNYVCIDTFSGFASGDADFERKERGKSNGNFNGFRRNSLRWFKRNLELNGFGHVRCVQADIKDYRFESPVSFCLLDVDLYLPTLRCLENLWPALSPGGVIVVDDCKPSNDYDGAFQAYCEFTARVGMKPEIVLGKLGALRKLSP